MKKTGLTTLFILYFVMLSFSQNRNSVWVFGDSAGIDFRNLNNPIPFFSSMDGRGSCVSICDSVGNLVLYSYTEAIGSAWSTRVHNRFLQPVLGADSITGEAWYNELVIIPKPGSNHEYYLLSLGMAEPINQGLFYTTIDINANGGLGAITNQNIQLNNVRNADCVQAIKHGNGRDWWIIGKYSDFNSTRYNRFFIYLVTPNGFTNPVIQDFNNTTDIDFQKLVVSPDGTKILQIQINGFMCKFDFDRCTGFISNPSVIYPEQTSNFNRLFWEGAFSLSGNIFYATTAALLIDDEYHLLQFDFASSNIPGSCDTLETWSDTTSLIGPGAVRLAPDGKIYFSRAYQCNAFPFCYPYPDSVHNYVNEYLSVINNPDVIGSGCDYQRFSFYLGGKRTYYGLPNNPNYELGPVIGSACDSLFLNSPETIKSDSMLHLIVFPNPSATGIFHFQLSDKTEKINFIEVYDVTGRIVFTTNRNVHEVNISSLLSGIYYYKVRTITEKVFNGKLVME